MTQYAYVRMLRHQSPSIIYRHFVQLFVRVLRHRVSLSLRFVFAFVEKGKFCKRVRIVQAIFAVPQLLWLGSIASTIIDVVSIDDEILSPWPFPLWA